MGQGLVSAWTEMGRRAAVLAGMCVAIISLIQHCPLWVASLRGAGAIVVVALLVHIFTRLLADSSAKDREEARARLLAASESPVASKVPARSGTARG